MGKKVTCPPSKWNTSTTEIARAMSWVVIDSWRKNTGCQMPQSWQHCTVSVRWGVANLSTEMKRVVAFWSGNIYQNSNYYAGFTHQSCSWAMRRAVPFFLPFLFFFCLPKMALPSFCPWGSIVLLHLLVSRMLRANFSTGTVSRTAFMS